MNKRGIARESLKHVDAEECWCSPRRMMTCKECEDEEDGEDCWACRGSGLVEHSGDPHTEDIWIHSLDG